MNSREHMLDPLVLPEEHIHEIEAKWAAESEDRIDAVDRGELQTVDDHLPFGTFACLYS